MAIGVQQTSKFHIGEAEIRIGPLSSANKLKQSDSVGLIQGATVSFTQETVDLEGGLPKRLVDTAIVKQVATINAQVFEYSRKNIRVMLGEGIEASPPAALAGTMQVGATATSSGTTTLQTSIPFASVAVGELYVLYNVGSPEKVSVVRVSAVANDTFGNADITIDNTKTPLLFDVALNDPIFRANQVGVGKSNATSYFALDVIGMEHSTGNPVGFKFWKAAVASGLEYGFQADNFAVTQLSFKVLAPAAIEYGTGQPLVHLADIVPSHPYGMYWSG